MSYEEELFPELVRRSDRARFAVKLIEREGTSAAEALHERKILCTLGLHQHVVSLIDHRLFLTFVLSNHRTRVEQTPPDVR